MSDESAHSKFGRRGFLGGVAVIAGAISLSAPSVGEDRAMRSTPSASAGDAPRLPLPEAGYMSFGPDEAGFVEALVNVLCPADDLTPNGVDCGLAVYFDRQLAGGFGKGERLYNRGPWKAGKPEHGYQLPLTPAQFFNAGVAAANEAAQKRYGRGFTELEPAEADLLLKQIAAGDIRDTQLPLASWFNELIYPLFVQACFADPVYGGNVGKVFWQMIGYPGLPAVHADDMVQFRGRPYPDAHNPKAIADFS